MNFDFVTANRIIFGPGTARQVGKLASEMGNQAMVVTGKDSQRHAFLIQDLKSHDIGFKQFSMRSPMMLPQIAVVDPELTYPMPPHVTAGTGLDALTQLLEAFVSTHANPMTDAICREGLKRAARSLERAY